MFNKTNEVIISWECTKCRGNEDVLLDKWKEIDKSGVCPHCNTNNKSMIIKEKTFTGWKR